MRGFASFSDAASAAAGAPPMRSVMRSAQRSIVGKVELAGMDIVEVSPPYDWAESTSAIANRVALEAISALADSVAASRAGMIRKPLTVLG